MIMIKKVLLLFLVSALILQAQAQNWAQIGQNIEGEAIYDGFGESISLSSNGSVVAIGTPKNNSNTGHVRIYTNKNGTWSQIGQTLVGEAAGNEFGKSISLSSDGSIVAIGAISNNGNIFNAGHVGVYQNISGTWTQIGANIHGEAEFDLFGSSVSLSSDGSILAIGAPGTDGNGHNAGRVRVYKNQNGTWTQIGADIDGEADYNYSGRTVSLSSDGSVIAIGASGNSENGTEAGHVRVYKNQNGTWTQIGLDIDGKNAQEYFGSSVSLSADGSIVAIGASCYHKTQNNNGYVSVYKNVNGVWTQLGQDIDGEAAKDYFGNSVSLSSDGSILAVGAMYNDGTGTDAGHVRVYKNTADIWTQIGADIDGKTENNNFGRSVSLSSDGSVLAIGVPCYYVEDIIGHVSTYKYRMTPPGNALNFDRTDEYITIPHSSDFNCANLTLEAWIKVSPENPENSIIMIKEGALNEYPFCFQTMSNTNRDLRFFSSGNTTIFDLETGPGVYEFDTWTHVAAVFSDNDNYAKIFVNGMEVASKDVTNPLHSNTYHINIGGRQYHNNSFKGSIDEVRIWNVARSQCEISGYMNTELTGNETGLVAYYNFNEGVADADNTGKTNLTDNSTNINNGTLQNFALNGTVSNWTASGANLTGWGTFNDVTAPVANAATLADVTAECEVTALTAPTATDICAGTITGTHDATLPITTQGTTVVTWTYDDGYNTATQQQNVVIEDVTKPTISCIADKAITLSEGQTAYTVSGTEFDPTSADDNCGVTSVVNDLNNKATLDGEIMSNGNTTVTWTITDNAGNTETCSMVITVNEYLSVNELSDLGITVFPVPNKGLFTISSNDVKIDQIKIIDITGKLIYKSDVNDRDISIDIRDRNNGIYFIHLTGESFSTVAKIIKQ